MSGYKYETEAVAKIIEALLSGSNRGEAAKAGDITRETFYQWLKTYPEFREKVESAEQLVADNMVTEVRASLYQRAVGYTFEEKKTEYGADREGRPIIVKQSVTKKSVPPDVAAAIFILTNKDPENWKNRYSTEQDVKVQGDTETRVSLSKVPDDLLEQVVKAIRGESD
jgi:transposase-like protein